MKSLLILFKKKKFQFLNISKISCKHNKNNSKKIMKIKKSLKN